MAMEGVGISLGLQLMAEIGDVTGFTHKGAINVFVGVNQSRTYMQKSVHASKSGKPMSRKTLFQVMDVLIKTKSQDAPVIHLWMGNVHKANLIMSTCLPE